jgi:hypothetical protein
MSHNPYTDDVLEVLNAAGMRPTIVGTGGGCTAIQVDVPETDGWHLLITDEDACVPETPGELIIAGLYDGEGYPVSNMPEDYVWTTDLSELVSGIRTLLVGSARR